MLSQVFKALNLIPWYEVNSIFPSSRLGDIGRGHSHVFVDIRGAQTLATKITLDSGKDETKGPGPRP